MAIDDAERALIIEFIKARSDEGLDFICELAPSEKAARKKRSLGEVIGEIKRMMKEHNLEGTVHPRKKRRASKAGGARQAAEHRATQEKEGA